MMRARIDEGGHLIVLRVGTWRTQMCPYQLRDNPCGDWCPLWEEQWGCKDQVPKVYLHCGRRRISIVVVGDNRTPCRDDIGMPPEPAERGVK